jgi:hypothetical protein
MITSLLETLRLGWLANVLTKLGKLWRASRIDELMPWAYAKPACASATWGSYSSYTTYEGSTAHKSANAHTDAHAIRAGFQYARLPTYEAAP